MNDETPMHPKFRRRRNNLLASKRIEDPKPLTREELLAEAEQARIAIFALEERERTARILWRSAGVALAIAGFYLTMWASKSGLFEALIGG